MGKLLLIEAELYNNPQLILPTDFNAALQYLHDRNTGAELSAFDSKLVTENPPVVDQKTKAAILEIRGPLSYKPTRFDALCGLQSYQQIESDVRAMIDGGAKKIALVIDSSGGEAYSCFETASLIRQLADKNNVRLIAYVDGVAASAAYGLSCVCHEVILNPDAQCGSIGCVVKLRNTNKALAKAGVEDTYLFSGSEKVPFNANGEWRKEFLEDIQEKVNDLYSKFTNFVAKNRSISINSVVDTKAKMFRAEQAVNLKLADRTMTREEFFKYLSTGAKPSASTKTTTIATKPKSETPSIQPKTELPKTIGIQKPIINEQRKISGAEKYLRDKYKVKTI